MNFELKKLVLDSREVAKMLGKEHKHLLRDIAKNMKYLIETKIGLNEFFIETSYKDKINRKLKRYDITKKGCEFLAHKLTGKKGAIFTATYINEFHRMEQALIKSVNKKVEMPKLPFEYKVEMKEQPELIKIYHTKNNIFYIKAKDLWRALEINQYLKSWINKRIEKYDFVEDFDFSIIGEDYALTLDMVKELCIIENTVSSKLIKKYILFFEKYTKDNQQKELQKLKERVKNKKLGYLYNNHKAIRKSVEEIITFAKTLQVGREKLINMCILLKAYAYPLELDKEYGINEEELITFDYYPIL